MKTKHGIEPTPLKDRAMLEEDHPLFCNESSKFTILLTV
jgi:hypothetical protein